MKVWIGIIFFGDSAQILFEHQLLFQNFTETCRWISFLPLLHVKRGMLSRSLKIQGKLCSILIL